MHTLKHNFQIFSRLISICIPTPKKVHHLDTSIQQNSLQGVQLDKVNMFSFLYRYIHTYITHSNNNCAKTIPTMKMIWITVCVSGSMAGGIKALL